MMTAGGEGDDGAEQGEINAENNNIVPQTSKEDAKEVENETTCNGVSVESSETAEDELSEVSQCENCDEIGEMQSDVLQVASPKASVSEPESDASEPESQCSRASGSDEGGAETQEQQDKMCQTSSPRDSPRRQSLVVLNLLRRLSEQEAANERLRLEKDRQLREITSSLLIFEGQLRREQERISRLLEERDARIAEQDRHIQALLRLNRRLAAKRCRTEEGTRTEGDAEEEQRGGKKKSKRQQRRISWHNEVYVITDYDKHWTQTNFRGRSGMGEVRRIEDYGKDRRNGEERDEEDGGGRTPFQNQDGGGRTPFQKEVDEVCDSVNMLVKGASSDGDSPLVDNHQLDRLVFPSVFDPPDEARDARSDAAADDPSLDDAGDARSPPSLLNPQNLGFYNRVMSNHRSVTKPKDVKYKKINRRKSKSLEELRGRLRKQVAPSLGIPAYPLLLESSEETQ